MAYEITITTEDDLWGLLEGLLAGEEGPRDFTIRGWNPSLLYFPHEPMGHTIRPSVARAISDFHIRFSRAYAFLVYGNANAKLLKQEDRELLDLSLLVVQGSTGLDAVDETLDRLVKGLIGRMSGRQIALVIASFLLLYFGVELAKVWLAEHYNEKIDSQLSEERIELSKQETARAKILADALSRIDGSEVLKSESDESKYALIRPSAQQDDSSVLGNSITRGQAKTILSKERKKGDGRRVDGIYRVVQIDTESDFGFVVRIENVETGETFPAEANSEELPVEDIHVIFKSAEEKGTFDALVNAWFVGDKVVRAQILRADEHNERVDGGIE